MQTYAPHIFYPNLKQDRSSQECITLINLLFKNFETVSPKEMVYNSQHLTPTEIKNAIKK